MKNTRISIILFTLGIFLFAMPNFGFARTYGQSLCKTEGFRCLRIKSYRQTWNSLWPNEFDRSIMMRVNRMNTQLYPGLVIAVPQKLTTADIMDFAPFPKQIDPPQEKL